MSDFQIAFYLANQVYLENGLDIYDRESDIQGKFYRQDNKLWLALRGSDHWRDWLINLQLWQKTEGKVGIHAGFNQAYKQVRSEAIDFTRNFDELHLTGHSSGGAIALLLSLLLSTKGKKIITYTFNSPKVGNKQFANLCDRFFLHHRHYNFYDPLIYLPWGNFCHCGEPNAVFKMRINPHDLRVFSEYFSRRQ